MVVRAGGTDYVGVADAIRRCADSLRALDAGGSRGSESVEALLEARDDILSKVEVAEGRYRAAGNALVEYAGALERAQTDSLNALVAAKSAQQDVDEAVARAGRMRESAGECPDQGDGADDRARYERAATAADGDAEVARGRVRAQRQVVLNAMGERDAAAVKAMSAIDGAGDDGLGDSWWDDWGSKVASWVAAVCDMISAVTGVLGLLVCWIPVIGQALAGVLFAVSAIAGIVAAIAHVALAVSGEESWMEALLSVAFAALGCLGLGAMKSVGTFMCKAMASRVVQQVGRTTAKHMANLAGMTEDVIGTLAGMTKGAMETLEGMRRLRTLRFAGRIGMRTLLRPGAWARIKAANNANNAVGRLGEEILLINSTAPKATFRMVQTSGRKFGEVVGRKPDVFLDSPFGKVFGDVKWMEDIPGNPQLGDFTKLVSAGSRDATLHIFRPEYYTQSTARLENLVARINEEFATHARETGIDLLKQVCIEYHSLEHAVGARAVAPVVAGAGVGHGAQGSGP